MEQMTRRGTVHRLLWAIAGLMAILLALVALPLSASAAETGGTWGSCTWTVEGDAIIVRATDVGNETGDAESSPWANRRQEDFPGVTRVVMGTADAPVKTPDYAAGLLAGFSPFMVAVQNVDLTYCDASQSTTLSFFLAGCEHLSEVELPSGFGNAALYANGLFLGCTALERVTSTDCKLPMATDLSVMFCDCESLDEITLPVGFAPSATNLYSLFAGCTTLSRADLGGFVPAAGASMKELFNQCPSLETVVLPEGFTAQAASVKRMFANCPSLKEIPATFALLAGVEVGSVFGFYESTRPIETVVTTYRGSDPAVIGYAWADDTRKLDLSAVYGDSADAVLQMDGRDLENTARLQPGDELGVRLDPAALSEMRLQDVTVQWQRRAAGASAFEDISGADGWTYRAVEADRGATLRAALQGMQNLTGLLLSDEVAVVGTSGAWGSCTWKVANGVLTILPGDAGNEVGGLLDAPWAPGGAADMDGVACIRLGEQGRPVQVTGTMASLFDADESPTLAPVKEIDLRYLEASGVDSLAYLFSGCQSLESVAFPASFDASAVDSLAGMFADCSSLRTVTYPSVFDTSGVQDMSFMFYACKSLTRIDFPAGFDTGQVTCMDAMFELCGSLGSLQLPAGFDTSQVQSMDSMFAGCDGFESLALPESFNTSKVTSMLQLFAGCDRLVSIELPAAFDTSKVTNMVGMFSFCPQLERVALPEAFTMRSVELMSNLFFECPRLVEIPAQVSIPAGAEAVLAFGFVDRAAGSPLATAYRGSDPGVICYPWAQDGRVLDIGTIMGGAVREAITLNGADLAVGARVAVGDELGAAVRPAELAALSLNTVAPQWQRRAAGTSDFVDIAGAQAWTYRTAAADDGAELRVVVSGSQNYTGSIASATVKVGAAPVPAAKALASTGDGTGTATAGLALCGLGALAVGYGAVRAGRRSR